MGAVEEGGDDAEIAAAAAQAPEEIGVALGAGGDDGALGGDDLAGQEVVDGEAMFAHQPADAAAEPEAGDARAGDDAGRHGQAMDMGLAIDIAERGAGLHARGARLRIDEHARHGREIDDDAIVAQRATPDIVAAASDGDEKIMRAREFHGVDDIGDPGAAGDEARMPVDATVPDLAGLVVACIVGLDDRAVEALLELLDDGAVERDAIALLQPIVSHVASQSVGSGSSGFVNANAAALVLPSLWYGGLSRRTARRSQR